MVLDIIFCYDIFFLVLLFFLPSKRFFEDRFLEMNSNLHLLLFGYIFRMVCCHTTIRCGINHWTYILHHCIDVKVLPGSSAPMQVHGNLENKKQPGCPRICWECFLESTLACGQVNFQWTWPVACCISRWHFAWKPTLLKLLKPVIYQALDVVT